MFERAVLQSIVDQIATVPHRAEVTSPYSFSIAPQGAALGAEYRIIGERFAFQLRVSAVTSYLAVGLRSAIISGARMNPSGVDRVRDELETSGWTPTIDLSGSAFRFDAVRDDIHTLDETALLEMAAHAACLISEFILAQLVVTKPYGEMRPAAIRKVAESRDPGDPWLYDPEERDRSTAVHQALENWLIAVLSEAGVTPLDPAGEPYFDLAWRNGDELVVCEVKSTVNSETKQLRLAVGQLLHYTALLRRGGNELVRGVILVPTRPEDDVWLDIASNLGFELIWPHCWPEVSELLTGAATNGAGLSPPEDAYQE